MAKDVGSVQRTLDQVLYTTDPRSLHGFILQTLEGSHDMRRKKPDSMALVVLKQFEHWCNTHPHIMTPQVRYMYVQYGAQNENVGSRASRPR